MKRPAACAAGRLRKRHQRERSPLRIGKRIPCRRRSPLCTPPNGADGLCARIHRRHHVSLRALASVARSSPGVHDAFSQRVGATSGARTGQPLSTAQPDAYAASGPWPAANFRVSSTWQSALVSQIEDVGGGERPNAVLFDVQSDQVEGIKKIFSDLDLPVMQHVPIVTMRVHSVKDVPVDQLRSEAAAADPGPHTRIPLYLSRHAQPE